MASIAASSPVSVWIQKVHFTLTHTYFLQFLYFVFLLLYLQVEYDVTNCTT